ncbi:hypothetical protein [Altererythrobacter sp.]|uniref:hypothetical protein n=1 Tax=Altererythrobacter sp. TaxID=1872480 RepID=UPI003CFBE711
MKGGWMLWLIGVPLVLAAAGYLIWQVRYPTYTYRFRMTVEVNTPEGLATGSSVYEVQAERTTTFMTGNDRHWGSRGEAVAVDLPGGRTLFALLKTSAHFGDMAGLSMNSLHPGFPGTGYDVVGVAKELSKGMHKGPAEVAPADYPMLVTFGDLGDPTSVALVDPDDLAASFDEGVSLKRITVQITRDPVTTGIEQRLGWLPAHIGSLVRRPNNVPIGNMPIEQRLNRTDFRSGVSQ